MLRSLNVEDMTGVLHGDDIPVADTVHAVARTDHGFFDTHAGRNRMRKLDI